MFMLTKVFCIHITYSKYKKPVLFCIHNLCETLKSLVMHIISAKKYSGLIKLQIFYKRKTKKKKLHFGYIGIVITLMINSY